MAPAGCLRQLLAQFADEDIDDLHVGFFYPAIEMAQKGLLGERRAFAQAQQLDHRVFLGGQPDRPVVDGDDVAADIDRQPAGADCRLEMPFGAAHDGLDTGDQLARLERLGHEFVGAKAQPLELVL